jgi:anti-sigma B factor antagonist
MLDIQIDDAGKVKLSGRFDAAAADRALATFRTLNQSLTVDFAEVEYISSAGIAVLVDTWKRLNGAGLTLRLVALQPRVRNVFAYAGLDRLLQIE